MNRFSLFSAHAKLAVDAQSQWQTQHIHWKQFSSLIFMKPRSVLWLAQSPKLFILVAQEKKRRASSSWSGNRSSWRSSLPRTGGFYTYLRRVTGVDQNVRPEYLYQIELNGLYRDSHTVPSDPPFPLCVFGLGRGSTSTIEPCNRCTQRRSQRSRWLAAATEFAYSECGCSKLELFLFETKKQNECIICLFYDKNRLKKIEFRIFFFSETTLQNFR